VRTHTGTSASRSSFVANSLSDSTGTERSTLSSSSEREVSRGPRAGLVLCRGRRGDLARGGRFVPPKEVGESG
jgi:alpha-D-ribose 1-methylphosphonate 5-triphosphate synthase subunit PhnG